MDKLSTKRRVTDGFMVGVIRGFTRLVLSQGGVYEIVGVDKTPVVMMYFGILILNPRLFILWYHEAGLTRY